MSNEALQKNDEFPEVLAYRVGQLELGMEKFEQKIETQIAELGKTIGSFNRWLIGVMGTLILALILLVVNLSTHAGNSVSVAH